MVDTKILENNDLVTSKEGECHRNELQSSYAETYLRQLIQETVHTSSDQRPMRVDYICGQKHEARDLVQRRIKLV